MGSRFSRASRFHQGLFFSLPRMSNFWGIQWLYCLGYAKQFGSYLFEEISNEITSLYAVEQELGIASNPDELITVSTPCSHMPGEKEDARSAQCWLACWN